MIRRSLFIITAIVAILFTSCSKYDNAIADIENRLDKIEGTSIPIHTKSEDRPENAQRQQVQRHRPKQ